jgi:hypothetical protein
MIYSKSDEFLIALSKNFNSAKLNSKITGLKIDNNDIITWIIREKIIEEAFSLDDLSSPTITKKI